MSEKHCQRYAFRGKKPSQSWSAGALFNGLLFFGLFSPIAVVNVLRRDLRANTSVGLDFTGSRHVGHVYCGWAGRTWARRAVMCGELAACGVCASVCTTLERVMTCWLDSCWFGL